MINKNKYIYISSNYSPNNYKKYILFRILKKVVCLFIKETNSKHYTFFIYIITEINTE